MSSDFDNINSFQLEEKRFLFVDVFSRNKELVFISPAYSDFKIFYNQIEVICNDIKLTSPTILEYRDSEPVVIIIFQIKMFNDQDIINTKILYLDKEIKIRLKYLNIKPSYNLVVSTLFKDDYKLFKPWYEYYINEGVDFFYMYYNGNLSEELKEYFREYKKIKLLEWPFHYWNKNQKLKHHAQSLEIHHSIYKYAKLTSNYIIINDLDEYLKVDNFDSIIKYLLSKPQIEVFKFSNHWSKSIDGIVPDSPPTKFLVTTTPTKGEWERSKCIYQVKKIKKIGIHKPCVPCPPILKLDKGSNLRMYHFFNWARPGRKIKEEFKETSFLPFTQENNQSNKKQVELPETKFDKILKVKYRSKNNEEDVTSIFLKNWNNLSSKILYITLKNIEVKKYFHDIDKGFPKELLIQYESGKVITCKEFENKFIEIK